MNAALERLAYLHFELDHSDLTKAANPYLDLSLNSHQHKMSLIKATTASNSE